MSVRVYVPGDSAACSVGADEVAAGIAAAAAARGVDVEIVRNGSRGMLWLEPFVEVQTSAGRVGYGPVAPGAQHGPVDIRHAFGRVHAPGVRVRVGHLAHDRRPVAEPD